VEIEKEVGAVVAPAFFCLCTGFSPLGNTAQFTPYGSGGVSRQNSPFHFPKMLADPPRIGCAFWFISRKNFPARFTTWKLCGITLDFMLQ